MTAIISTAWYTLKQNMRNKVFLIAAGFGIFMIIFSILIGEMSGKEQERVIIDFSLAIIQLVSIFLAVLIGAYQFKEELDKGIVSIIVTKAITRPAYLLGKYLGGVLTICLNIIGMGLVVVAVLLVQKIAFPVNFPLAMLAFLLETMIILLVSVFFSLIASSIIATAAAIGFTAIGHFSRDFYLLSHKGHGPARLMGKFLYYALPDLEKFNLKAQVLYNIPISAHYLMLISGYALFFVVLIYSLNVLIFNRQNLWS